MHRRRLRTVCTTGVCLALATAAFASSGCLLVAAGAAAGGAVGYAYYQGKHCGTYSAGSNDTWVALHTALRELGMPIVGEQADGDERYVEARTPNGERVRIYVDSVPGANPSENALSRVCIRVATFGDAEVSARILDQVGTHLMVAPAGPPQTAPPPLAQTDAPPLAATPPPALLPPEPVRAATPGR